MAETLHVHEISLGIGVLGIAVVLWGLAQATVSLVRLESSRLYRRDPRASRQALRHGLGFYLLLGLEFLVAADIVDTILKPGLEELAILGGILLIRTLISFSLNRELSAPVSSLEG